MFTRRQIVSGIAATVSLPAWAQTIPTNPDVVIVGAGSAGLSAAHALIKDGYSVVIVEAANRAGGRAYTESDTFGLPFDHGCSWISAPQKNPYRN